MRMKIKLLAVILAAVLFAMTPAARVRAERLTLGAGGEFAIDTEEGWKYYTPDSDLSDVETTAGYLFRRSDKYVCYVVAGGTTVIITYYATDSNAGLKGRDRLMKCIEYGYGPDAAFFDSGFAVSLLRGGFLFDQRTEMFGKPMCSITAYLILDHGIIGIAVNGSDHDGMAEIVGTLVRDVVCREDNPIL